MENKAPEITFVPSGKRFRQNTKAGYPDGLPDRVVFFAKIKSDVVLKNMHATAEWSLLSTHPDPE